MTFSKIIRYSLAFVAIFSALSFLVLIASPKEENQEAAGMSLGRAVISGIAAFVMFRRSKMQEFPSPKTQSNPTSGPQSTVTFQQELSPQGQESPVTGKLRISPEELARLSGRQIAKSFSRDAFMELFGSAQLAQNWSMDDAFAEWCARADLSFVIACWASIKDGNKVPRVISLARKAMVAEWGLSDHVFEKLRAISNETEAPAYRRFNSCETEQDLAHFGWICVSRISGSGALFGTNVLENELLGPALGVSYDLMAVAVFARFFVEAGASIKLLLDDTEVEWGTSCTKVEEFAEFERRASLGEPEAQINLGNAYRSGKGVAQSKSEALRWFRKAAEQGNAAGQRHLGYLYDNGEGVAKNRAEAVRLYREAANKGDAPAQILLSLMYHEGDGVKRDHVEAVRWYRVLAESGRRDAQYSLGEAFRLGQGVAMNRIEAVHWYRRAADQGQSSAQRRLEVMSSSPEN